MDLSLIEIPAKQKKKFQNNQAVEAIFFNLKNTSYVKKKKKEMILQKEKFRKLIAL